MDLLPFVHILEALAHRQGTYGRRSAQGERRGRPRPTPTGGANGGVVVPTLGIRDQAFGTRGGGASADDAHELFFGDHSGHALCLHSRSESESTNGIIAICPYVSKGRFVAFERRGWSRLAEFCQQSASADEAYELLFDDRAGHALHFGEAAGEGGCGLAAVVFYAGATNLILGK